VLERREIFMIHELHREGLSIRAIARRTGLSRKTVRKYLQQGLAEAVYGPRAPRPTVLDKYKHYIRGRLAAYPDLSAVRLQREITEMGYAGGYTSVKDFVRQVRPDQEAGYEHRYETPAGKQAQVDFAYFKVCFSDEPEQERVVWLFSMVLGYSRHLFCRFVCRQNLPAVVRCHIGAFAALGGVPREILYDRMKTVVVDGTDARHIIYHPTLLDLAGHYHFMPRACPANRAKTKGKVERPYRYVRQDFFLGRVFKNLEDLNEQLREWLKNVANRRRHGTTRRWVHEAFAEECRVLQSLPAVPFRSVLKLERRISRDGMVSVDGNFYSVPDTTRRRVVEVQVSAEQVYILDEGNPVAIHPVLEGRGQRRVAAGHRRYPPPGGGRSRWQTTPESPLGPPGQEVARRELDVYDTVAGALAARARETL
jgi:transposase